MFQEQSAIKIRDLINRIKYLESLENVSVSIKDTAGNPATGRTGQIVINTVDETISIYAFGSWRDISGGGSVHREDLPAATLMELKENEVYIPGDDLKLDGDLNVGDGEVFLLGGSNPNNIAFGATAGSGQLTILEGIFSCYRIPVSCKIVRWDIVAPLQSGSITFDIYKGAYADLPLSSGDSICGSDKPEMSSDQKASGTALTGWTTRINEGEYIAFCVDSVLSLKMASITLTVIR